MIADLVLRGVPRHDHAPPHLAVDLDGQLQRVLPGHL